MGIYLINKHFLANEQIIQSNVIKVAEGRPLLRILIERKRKIAHSCVKFLFSKIKYYGTNISHSAFCRLVILDVQSFVKCAKTDGLT